MSNNVGMGEIFHDLDLLINVFLKIWFFLDVCFADDLDCKQFIIIFFLRNEILFLARITSPNAPFPIDFIVS